MSFRGLDFSSGINKFADLMAQSYKDRYQIEQDKIKNDMAYYQANSLYGAPLPESNPYQGPVFFQEMMPQMPMNPQVTPGEDLNFPTSMNEQVPERMPAQNDQAEAARLQGDLARGRVGQTANSRGMGITPQTAAEDLAMIEIERRKKAAQGGAPESQVGQMFKAMVASNPDIIRQYGPYLNKMYLELKQREMSAERPSGLEGLAALLKPQAPPAQARPASRGSARDPRIAAIEKQIDQTLKQIPKPPKMGEFQPELMVEYSAKIAPFNEKIERLQAEKNKILGINLEDNQAVSQSKPKAKQALIRVSNGETLTEEEYKKKYPKGYEVWKKKQAK